MHTSEAILLHTVSEMLWLLRGDNFKQGEHELQTLKVQQDFDKQRMEHSRRKPRRQTSRAKPHGVFEGL
jgi:hypothetical protein